MHIEYVVTEFVTGIETPAINAAKNGHLQTKGKSLTLEILTLACTFHVAYVLHETNWVIVLQKFCKKNEENC